MNPLDKRKAMIEKGIELSIAHQCELLDIHRSGFYYTPVPESDENLEIMQILDEQYFETPFFGLQKLLVHLTIQGYKINPKRLRRLMRLQGWQTIYTTPKTTKSDPTAYKYPYLLKDLKIDRKNQAWEIDITYIPMKKGFMYLCAIIDVHTRFIVGWGISNTMTAQWCTEVVEHAILTHGKPEILNSDQGSQFTSNEYTELLKREKILISMDGKGRAIDNIYIERFWRTIKYEYIYLQPKSDGLSLYQGIDGFMTFYNTKRFHQSLDYQTPLNKYQYAA
jgi:putative transposase